MTRYLTYDGVIGVCPEEYEWFVAADRCNCTPWELLEQSIYWKYWGLRIAIAEGRARKAIAARK